MPAPPSSNRSNAPALLLDPRGPHPAGERPATDAQLIRLGRGLGLLQDEVAALLELLDEGGAPTPEAGPDGATPGRLLAQALQACPQALAGRLRMIPGLFLLTGGVTAARTERARERVQAVVSVSLRIARFMQRMRTAATGEARLLLRVAVSLRDAGMGQQLGPLPDDLLPSSPQVAGGEGTLPRGLGPEPPSAPVEAAKSPAKLTPDNGVS